MSGKPFSIILVSSKLFWKIFNASDLLKQKQNHTIESHNDAYTVIFIIEARIMAIVANRRWLVMGYDMYRFIIGYG